MQLSAAILPNNRLAFPYCRVGFTLWECQSWIRHWIRKQWPGKRWDKTQDLKWFPHLVRNPWYRVVNQNLKMFDIFSQHGNRILVMKQTNERKSLPDFWIAALFAPPWTPNRRNKELQSGGAEYYCQDFPGITQVKVTVDALVSLMIKGERNEARIFVAANMMPRDIIFENL